jgi:hypothetical protein
LYHNIIGNIYYTLVWTSFFLLNYIFLYKKHNQGMNQR